MKNYNKTFVYNLSVDVVAAALLKVFNRDEPSGCVNSNCSDEELKEYQEQADKNAAYYTRLAECIIDPIQDNANALGHLYNTINGWVKTETPLDTTDLHKHVEKAAQQDGNSIWQELEAAKYVSLLYYEKRVVGKVNYVDNGVNLSFQIRGHNADGTRKTHYEVVHIEDIEHAENCSALPATFDEYEEYQDNIGYWEANH